MPSTPDQSRKAVGIVDDDDDVRTALEALLESHGFAAVPFGHADALLASSALDSLACVVTDLQMPGTNGLALARALQPRGVPVILITAFSTPATARQAQEAGIRLLLEKPFPPQDLVAAIRAILAGPD